MVRFYSYSIHVGTQDHSREAGRDLSEPLLLSVLQDPHGTLCDNTEEQSNTGTGNSKKMEE